jgi:hypothetical protein
MEPSKPVNIANQLRRGSLDSNMDRRDSIESGSTMQGSRSSSFDGGKSVDEARLQFLKANRAGMMKKVWEPQDTATAFWSA